MYDNFLSPRECDGLIGAHHKHMTERESYQPIICFDSLDTLRRHLVDAKKSHIRMSMKDFVQGMIDVHQLNYCSTHFLQILYFRSQSLPQNFLTVVFLVCLQDVILSLF